MAQAFAADIAAVPADDGPRLIMADWLEDHGQPERAEFVRLQCQLVNHPSHHTADSGCPLRRRERDLIEAHGAEWFRGDRGMAPGTPVERNAWTYRAGFVTHRYWLGFRRGFLATFDGPAIDFWGQPGKSGIGPELVRLLPLERVEVSDCSPIGSDTNGWLWPAWSDADERIPTPIVLFLPDEQAGPGGYRTEQAGRAALSAACLAWANRPECRWCKGRGLVFDRGLGGICRPCHGYGRALPS